MLLVWYKREFDWSDILRLWEGLWTDYLTSQFHLFIAVAILEKHREVIMQHLKHFDEVLKYINELSGTIDLSSTLVRAEGLFRRFEKTVEAVDRKAHFPAPAGPIVRQRRVGMSPSREGGGGAPPTSSASGASSAAPESSGASTGAAVAKGIGAEKKEQQQQQQQVITPELRSLLSRKVIVLDGMGEGGTEHPVPVAGGQGGIRTS